MSLCNLFSSHMDHWEVTEGKKQLSTTKLCLKMKEKKEKEEKNSLQMELI